MIHFNDYKAKTMICTKCKIDLPENFFSIRADTNKPRRQCKCCRSTIRKSHYENNKSHCSEWAKKYNLDNKEKRSLWAKQYYIDNKKSFAFRSKKWRSENREKSRKLSKSSSSKFRKTNYGKFREMVRSSARRYGDKFDIKNLPYSVDQFVQRIEFNFKDGMSWENYGDWEIDHTKPVKRFYEQGKLRVELVNSLCNLKPLWKSENRKKSCKFVK